MSRRRKRRTILSTPFKIYNPQAAFTQQMLWCTSHSRNATALSSNPTHTTTTTTTTTDTRHHSHRPNIHRRLPLTLRHSYIPPPRRLKPPTLPPHRRRQPKHLANTRLPTTGPNHGQRKPALPIFPSVRAGVVAVRAKGRGGVEYGAVDIVGAQ